MKPLAKNRKALHNHEVLEKFVAGIELRGYEVKAIKEGKADFEGSFVRILGKEALVVNLHIGRYSKQSQSMAETAETRSRKLMLTRKEIQKVSHEIHQKGKTAIPLALLLHRGLVKLEFAIVKGRKKHEKKLVAKERQIKKDLAQHSL